MVKWVPKGFTSFQKSEGKKLKFGLKLRTGGHKKGAARTCRGFVDAVSYFCFCSQTCCLHLCKQEAKKVNIRGKMQEREKVGQVLAAQQRNLMGLAFNSVVSSSSNPHEEREQMSNKSEDRPLEDCTS